MAQTILVVNANAFKLAARYYGDATQFINILLHNGLTDPNLNFSVPTPIIIHGSDLPETGGVPTL